MLFFSPVPWGISRRVLLFYEMQILSFSRSRGAFLRLPTDLENVMPVCLCVGCADAHICDRVHHLHMSKHLFISIICFASMCHSPHGAVMVICSSATANEKPERLSSSHLYFQVPFALHGNIRNDVSLFTDTQVGCAYSWKKRTTTSTPHNGVCSITQTITVRGAAGGNWSTFIQKGVEYTIQTLFRYTRC